MDIRYTSVNGNNTFRLQPWKKILIVLAFIVVGVLLFDTPLSQDVIYGN